MANEKKTITLYKNLHNSLSKATSSTPGVLEGLKEQPLQHVEVRRQDVANGLRQLVQHHESELAVVLRLRVLCALSHQIQQLCVCVSSGEERGVFHSLFSRYVSYGGGPVVPGQ